MIGLRSIYFSSKDHSVLYYGDKNGTGLLNYVAELSMNSTVQILSLSVGTCSGDQEIPWYGWIMNKFATGPYLSHFIAFLCYVPFNA